MKKRLRKKRRLGEFRQDGFQVTFQMLPSVSEEEIDMVTDQFLEMLESQDLAFGGGGTLCWTGVVQDSGRGTVREDQRTAVMEWLARHPAVQEVTAGPLRDLWHGWQ